MPFPSMNTFRALLTPGAAQQADDADAQSVAYLATEHKDDGTHAAILADALTVRGGGSITLDDPIAGSTTITQNNLAGGVVVDGSVIFQANGVDALSVPSAGAAPYGTGHGVVLYDGTGSPLVDLSLQPTAGAGYPFDLVWGDRGNLVAVTHLRRLSGGLYALLPDRVTQVVTGVTLGTATAGEAWTEIHGLRLFDQGRTAAAMGEWIAPAFDASIFTAASGTWTVTSGERETLVYTLIGKTMTVAWELGTTTVSTPTASLSITIPGGFASSVKTSTVCYAVDNGTAQAVRAHTNAGGTAIVLTIITASANWQASTNLTDVRGQMTFEVQ